MDESNQIGERASLPHKVVHQEIALSGLHPANELGLMSQTLITTGSSMPYRISLNNCTTDANFLRAINPLGQGGGQGGRDFVYSLGFQRMNGYQFHGAAVEQSADPCNAVCFFERCDEPVGGGQVTGFGGPKLWVTFDGRFLRVDEDIREAEKRYARRRHDRC